VTKLLNCLYEKHLGRANNKDSHTFTPGMPGCPGCPVGPTGPLRNKINLRMSSVLQHSSHLSIIVDKPKVEILEKLYQKSELVWFEYKI